MLPHLRWTEKAREDLLDIYAMIGRVQPAAAERYFDRIEAKATLLTALPRIGVRRSDIRPGLRMLVQAPYLILYRIEPETDEGEVSMIEIVRVVDGRRELTPLF